MRPSPPILSRRNLLNLLLPWLLAGLVISGGMTLYYEQRNAALREHLTESRVNAEQFGSRLSAWLRDRVAIVEHMAQHHGDSATTSAKRDFEAEAGAFVERVPGFRALNWINQQGVISIVVPFEANKGALGRNLLEHENDAVRNAAAKAINERVAARTGSIELYQGGKGISMYLPVPGGNGVMNGVFRVDHILRDALPESILRDKFSLALFDQDNTKIYSIGPQPAADQTVFEYSIEFVDRPLLLRVMGRGEPGAAAALTTTWWLAGSALAGLLLGLLLHLYLRRQHQFREQSRQIRLIMDSTVEGMLGLDLDGVCVFCNAAAVIELGFADADELIGHKLLEQRLLRIDGATDGSSPESVQVMGEVRMGLTRENRSAFMLRKDGTRFAVEYLATPTIQRGEVTGAVFTFFDITDEVGETELLNRYRQVMDSIRELTVLTDAQGNVEVINPAGIKMLKAGSSTAVGQPMLSLFNSKSATQIKSIALPAAERQGVWDGESELQATDGSNIPVRLVILRLEDRVGDDYYSIIARDISDDRRMEAEQQSLRRQFQHAQKMESLGLLAGGIAHDFNNILVAVLGNASLAMEHLTPGSKEHGLMTAVETATQRAADLTRQLLAYSGRGRFELAITDIGLLVTEMAGLLRASIPPSVRLSVTCEPDMPAALVDPTQIRQLVMNLITNGSDAVDAEGDGHVEVRVQRLRWDPSMAPQYLYGRHLPAGEYLAVKIEDNGPGMDAEVIARIFDPFFSTKPTGKGLGLSAVLGIVQGHNGMLCLESSAESGTCFMLALPVSADAPLVQQQEELAHSNKQFSGKVLLIDDEPMVREFAEAALTTLGFEVLSAANGSAGLEIFRAHADELALVLVDQSMPGLSGAETRQQMLEFDDSVPSVLMSGYDEKQVSSTLAEMGFGGFLKKPFRYGELRNLLQRVLDQAA